MLESFDNHPPIILPSGGFKVDLEVETLDDNIYRHLLYIRHFLWSLQSKSPHTSEEPGSAPPKVACTPRRDYSSPGWAGGSWVPLETLLSPVSRACCPRLQPRAAVMPSCRAAGRISAANPPAWGVWEGELEGQARPSNLVRGEEGGGVCRQRSPSSSRFPPSSLPCTLPVPTQPGRLAQKH